MIETQRTQTPGDPELTLKRFALRSLLPAMAVLLILSTFVIGPWGFAGAVASWWLIQRQF